VSEYYRKRIAELRDLGYTLDVLGEDGDVVLAKGRHSAGGRPFHFWPIARVARPPRSAQARRMDPLPAGPNIAAGRLALFAWGRGAKGTILKPPVRPQIA
jgi:hypothetical protein